MKLENEYLSDEELEQLILRVEENELVTAPPDLLDNIMTLFETKQEVHMLKAVNYVSKQHNSSKNKVREFRRYCFRVLTSVAAAIMIVFMLPEFLNMQLPKVRTRPDVLEPGKYATKEEALCDTGFLMQTLGGTNIFSNDNELNIFIGENGG